MIDSRRILKKISVCRQVGVSLAVVEAMFRKLCAPAVLTFLLGWSASASASVMVSCPGTADTSDREFTLTTDVASVCYDYDSGNINGNNDAINAQGWTTIESSTSGNGTDIDFTGAGGSSGTFTIDASVWNQFGSIILALKSGEGQLDPDWAAFLLAPNTTSGSWSIDPTRAGGLSHMIIYGQGDAPPPPSVPEPTSMLLLGTGLIGVASQVRRRFVR